MNGKKMERSKDGITNFSLVCEKLVKTNAGMNENSKISRILRKLRKIKGDNWKLLAIKEEGRKKILRKLGKTKEVEENWVFETIERNFKKKIEKEFLKS